MKNAIALAAVAGLATGAMAQDLSLTPSGTTFDTSGGSVTFTVLAFADNFAGEEAVSGTGNIGISGSGSAVGGVTDVTVLRPAWANLFGIDGAFDGNGGHTGADGGQIILEPFFPPAPDSLFANGPVNFFGWTYTVAAGTVGSLDLAMFEEANTSFIIQTFDADAPAPGLTDWREGDVNLSGATVNFVPAPSAMALLGLGGLVAGRRRR